MTKTTNSSPTTKVSVLVAVYNTEKYLSECLDSLSRQTHKNLEILCVDDCSTDHSLDILNDYAAKDERIRVWHLDENKGQAKARNLAISHSTGDISMFLDSDDWISDDAIEHMVECFQQDPDTGCVLFDVRYKYPDGREEGYTTPPFNVMDGREAFRKSLTWGIHGVYAVRGDMQRQYPYDDSCRHYSDDNTTRIHYLLSKEVRCCEGKYFYRQHESSVSHIVGTSRLDLLRANESMKQQLMQLNVSEEDISLYENERWKNLLAICILYIKQRKNLNKKERESFKSEIKRIWGTIDSHRLYPKNKYKPGYYPFANHWSLFYLEYHLFAFARIIINR